MKYMGSKWRIWQYLAPIILRDRREGQWYVEPFCGGCNSIYQVTGRRIAADINPYLIAMFRSLLAEEPQIYPIPRTLYLKIREEYYAGRTHEYTEAEMGWVGHMASYNGRFFGGYSGNNVVGQRETRNYIDESIRNVLRTLDGLRGVDFRCCPYDELDVPRGSIIYCDPPYRDTTEYEFDGFNYRKFYIWCYNMSRRGHKVFISECSMPRPFREVWSGELICNLGRTKPKIRVEKLFTI